MCLIAYAPKGQMIEKSVLAYAYNKNPDGIGVMSANGIEKFMGHKALKRVRRYIETMLVPDEIPYAIHFRWATHGDISLANTHPYQTPEGKHWVMHNGVIWCTAQEATANESDTAIFVRKHMTQVPGFDDTAYFQGIATQIGNGSKLCIMNDAGEFHLCNAYAGDWIDGIWFSNTYSLPSDKIPRRSYPTYSTGAGYYMRSYEPKEIWSHETNVWAPNPAYKAAEDVVILTEKPAASVTYLPRAKEKVWPEDDRRAYYEALEAGLNPRDAEYYDEGVRSGESALNEALAHVAGAEERRAKEEAPIGGDFAPEEDDEEQNRFRRYLKKVAAGIYAA